MDKLSVIIAIGMLYIAYQQWVTNERKRKQDLFDKRWDCYLRLKKIFESIPNCEEEFEETDIYFNDIFDEILFLFDKNIQDHIANIKEIALSRNYDAFVEPFKKYLCIEQRWYDIFKKTI